MKRYREFSDWLDEVENYGTRRERFMNTFDNHAEVLKWLESAWYCARDEMSDEEAQLTQFEERMKSTYPLMFSDVSSGISVGIGWLPIIERLVFEIDRHVDWNNARRKRFLESNPDGEDIPDEVEYPRIAQIKEKFGQLRFYYDGGDDYVSGLVTMAENWADKTCEKCGQPGKLRHGGWIKTLCDEHEAERQEAIRARM